MSWRRVSLVVIVPVVVVAAGATSASAGGGRTGGRYEVDVSHNNGSTVVGEPEIAVDPKNPENIYVAWATFPVPVTIDSKAPPRSCGAAVSNDGGAHWHDVSPPVNDLPYITGCEDGVAVAGPDGTLYQSGDMATFTGVASGGISLGGSLGGIVVHGQDWVTASKNWGRSWSTPVETMGSDGTRFQRGAATVPIDTFDRPWIAVDQSTGIVYAIGHDIVDHNGYVTASTDHARSFGPVYPTDSPAYPHDSNVFGGNVAASNGIVATAYTASRAPGATCPCVVFETSTDQGATWDRHLVPVTDASSAPTPLIAADPSHKGHFALQIFDSTGTENQVYTTDDAGATWAGPTDVAESPPDQRFKPWISYGPDGDLALVWRTWHGAPGTSPYDVWAAVGRARGQGAPVFSAPVRISSATGSYPKGYLAGDDFSWVVVAGRSVYVGWGDARSGPVQAWISRVPLADFAIPGGLR
ncbi:MAG: sialidase family protein [Acidimicrobiales bacterium]